MIEHNKILYKTFKFTVFTAVYNIYIYIYIAHKLNIIGLHINFFLRIIGFQKSIVYFFSMY